MIEIETAVTITFDKTKPDEVSLFLKLINLAEPYKNVHIETQDSCNKLLLKGPDKIINKILDKSDIRKTDY